MPSPRPCGDRYAAVVLRPQITPVTRRSPGGRMSRTTALLLATALTALIAAPAAAQLDSTFFKRMEARSIGPTGVGGRGGALHAGEADPDIVYVGAATGGLWKSANGGVTWTPLTDSLPAASIGAIAIYQPTPDLVWVRPGERQRPPTPGVGTRV